ncbi:MAG: hypothetical protein GKR89_37260 [Candidatus Latescibacteria bacterium]|nr:hypothetical protein [Candidatus Latescibacterota bacterium]
MHTLCRDGSADYEQVMTLPDHRSRRAAVHYSGALPVDQGIELVGKALADPNRKVRNAALVYALGALDVDEDRRRRHWGALGPAPAFDPSRRDRWRRPPEPWRRKPTCGRSGGCSSWYRRF